jgi:hypothetical protein
MGGSGGPYATRVEIEAFASKMNPDFLSADLTDKEILAAQEIINERSDTVWNLFSGSKYVDGTGNPYIFSPIVPIVTLTSVKIIAIDTTETSLIVSGSTREIIADFETGMIKRVQGIGVEYGEENEIGPYFPLGVQNIKLTGTFGQNGASANTLNLLQTLLCILTLSKKFSGKYNSDLVMERIGEYEYRTDPMQYSKNPKNQKMTLEGYIDYLFESLPKEGSVCVFST